MQETRNKIPAASVYIVEMRTIQSDIFNRESIAKTMCKYIVETPSDIISPIILDGQWGSGKTTHAIRMRECIRREYKDSVKCIYWNASASDFSSDPLAMFAAALYKNIPVDKKGEFEKNAFSLCCGGALAFTGSIINQLIQSKVGVDFTKAVADAKSGAAYISSPELEEKFASFLETAGDNEKSIAAARVLVQLLKEDTQSLVIIIDELDRCRPDFALKMIEIIKHLFDEVDCKFLLVMNKFSICSAIGSLYGLNYGESLSYLSKYIKTEFQLPRSIIRGAYQDSELCAVCYFYELLKRDGERPWRNNKLLSQLVSYIIDTKSLQLRDIEKWVRTIRFIHTTIPKGFMGDSDDRNDFYDCLICFLAYLLTFEHDEAMKMRSKETNTDLLLSSIDCETDPSKRIVIEDPDSIKYIRFVLDYFFANDDEEREQVQREQALFNRWPMIEKGGQVIDIWLTFATFMR